MKHERLQQLIHASDCVANEEVIAYPTETVFGLGCDPLSETAIKKLLMIKDREWQKGLIVIAATVEQLSHFLSPEWLQWLTKKQPLIPTTYVVPCLSTVSFWLKGAHDTLAVRITTDEISRKLCQLAGPLVSTSANEKGSEPLLNSDEVSLIFKGKLGFVISEDIALRKKLNNESPVAESSQIIDAVSGNILRP